MIGAWNGYCTSQQASVRAWTDELASLTSLSSTVGSRTTVPPSQAVLLCPSKSIRVFISQVSQWLHYSVLHPLSIGCLHLCNIYVSVGVSLHPSSLPIHLMHLSSVSSSYLSVFVSLPCMCASMFLPIKERDLALPTISTQY